MTVVVTDARCSLHSKNTKPNTNMTLARSDFHSFEIVIRTFHVFVLHLFRTYVAGRKKNPLFWGQHNGILWASELLLRIWFANRSFGRSLGECQTCAIHLQNHLIENGCNRFGQNGCISNKCVGPRVFCVLAVGRPTIAHKTGAISMIFIIFYYYYWNMKLDKRTINGSTSSK